VRVAREPVGIWEGCTILSEHVVERETHLLAELSLGVITDAAATDEGGVPALAERAWNGWVPLWLSLFRNMDVGHVRR
jgi:hypothetical protein